MQFRAKTALSMWLISLVIANYARSAIVVSFDTPGTATMLTIGGSPYLSYTFLVEPNGADIRGFDARFTSATMKQHHPIIMGMPKNTVFQDFNGSLTAMEVAEDSQIETSAAFWSTSVADVDTETPGELTGAVADAAISLTTQFPLAHVVIPSAAFGTWEFTPLLGSGLVAGTTLSGQFGAVPEISQVVTGTVLLVGVLGVGIARRLLRFAAA